MEIRPQNCNKSLKHPRKRHKITLLLIKSDRYGALEWQKSFGGSQLDVANHIEQTSDGGFIISATTESYAQGGKDIWLFKTDA